jgi:hypothetical protein
MVVEPPRLLLCPGWSAFEVVDYGLVAVAFVDVFDLERIHGRVSRRWW